MVSATLIQCERSAVNFICAIECAGSACAEALHDSRDHRRDVIGQRDEIACGNLGRKSRATHGEWRNRFRCVSWQTR